MPKIMVHGRLVDDFLQQVSDVSKKADYLLGVGYQELLDRCAGNGGRRTRILPHRMRVCAYLLDRCEREAGEVLSFPHFAEDEEYDGGLDQGLTRFERDWQTVYDLQQQGRRGVIDQEPHLGSPDDQ